ncbi:MAG: hypothetical protein ACFCGT_06945 [Sandaracinaceae bacterium]
MRVGDPVHPELGWVRRIHDLDEARAVARPGPRARALRRAGEVLGDALREGPEVVSVRSLHVSDLVYPSRFAFHGALSLPLPYVMMRHRCLLVQVRAEGTVRNVLFNPSDREGAKATPYFRRLLQSYPFAEALVGAPVKSLVERLADHGLAPEDIDLVAFDHFHTQDLRPTLGTLSGDGLRGPWPARFPNAKLLAPRVEWEDWDDLHPLQRPWFVADGKKGLDPSRVVLTDGDLQLGDGLLLLATPGHTRGNQTLFAHTPEGVFGCSENGTSADSWSPYESRLPGLRRHARLFDAEAVLNCNTPEGGAEQLTSMILERAIVDRVAAAPAFVQMYPSSEVTPSPLAPGVQPSMVFGERTFGEVVRPPARASSALGRAVAPPG